MRDRIAAESEMLISLGANSAGTRQKRSYQSSQCQLEPKWPQNSDSHGIKQPLLNPDGPCTLWLPARVLAILLDDVARVPDAGPESGSQSLAAAASCRQNTRGWNIVAQSGPVWTWTTSRAPVGSLFG
ncbi:hypothetical protein GGTG_10650 [Gaeumannomyces tritici R3-111a-1]|uniref:Uncharacterized protein n=1 Tax=Gaeumannomyces tritici (strain R3-111a-1) TaxID=644352 RepID=J3PAX5_GAET3|nr:hypothetical protein GGTG_10650 [Gaeumannomyces tritici R3-111a-1]EJT71391.1 hypothetical protein GGTG_10650 [Gaeumannomyces tritici R3-111a-1]